MDVLLSRYVKNKAKAALVQAKEKMQIMLINPKKYNFPFNLKNVVFINVCIT